MNKIAKRLLIAGFAFVLLSGLFYHSGLNAHCPFCITGVSSLKFIQKSTYHFPLFSFFVIILILTGLSEKQFVTSKGFSNRAPPY